MLCTFEYSNAHSTERMDANDESNEFRVFLLSQPGAHLGSGEGQTIGAGLVAGARCGPGSAGRWSAAVAPIYCKTVCAGLVPPLLYCCSPGDPRRAESIVANGLSSPAVARRTGVRRVLIVLPFSFPLHC